jgi:hypothetical protein
MALSTAMLDYIAELVYDFPPGKREILGHDFSSVIAALSYDTGHEITKITKEIMVRVERLERDERDRKDRLERL